ncbi:MAG: glutamate mutase L [Pseudomonadota bacterium]
MTTSYAGYAIDIGSTVIKRARLEGGSVVEQIFVQRDHAAGIPAQMATLLAQAPDYRDGDEVLLCSSANGGLRVGILCLTEKFSGAAVRNQVLLAGANPTYVLEITAQARSSERVDILIITGAIDDEDCAPMAERMASLDLSRFNFDALIYAGNRHLAASLKQRHGELHVVANPIAGALRSERDSVFEAVRDAYLKDLVHKEGVSELPATLTRNIRPTPEVVNRGFQQVIANRSSIVAPGASVVIDIGGATTDLHYTVEIVRDDSEHHPNPGVSVARHVFADLGIVASRDSTMLQLRTHPRVYEFLSVVLGSNVRDAYEALREGEYNASAELLAYGCLFIAFDRFGAGRGPGLPAAHLNRISHLLMTGGAAQALDPDTTTRLLALFDGNEPVRPQVIVDNNYQLWIDGITAVSAPAGTASDR